MVVQLAGSLVAILALAGVAWWLRLGGGPLDEAGARAAAAELGGFDPAQVVVGTDGAAALVTSIDGGIAVVRLHGAHAVARRLAAPVMLTDGERGVSVATGERMFGDVMLSGWTAARVRAVLGIG